MENKQSVLDKAAELLCVKVGEDISIPKAELLDESPYEYVYGGDTYEDDWCS